MRILFNKRKTQERHSVEQLFEYNSRIKTFQCNALFITQERAHTGEKLCDYDECEKTVKDESNLMLPQIIYSRKTHYKLNASRETCDKSVFWKKYHTL